jgi:hypothetical protein
MLLAVLCLAHSVATQEQCCYSTKYANSYLAGYPAGITGTSCSACSFDDAKTKCTGTSGCNGITLGGDGTYSLRSGTTPSPSSSGETSWLKSDCATCAPTPAPEKSGGKSSAGPVVGAVFGILAVAVLGFLVYKRQQGPAEKPRSYSSLMASNSNLQESLLENDMGGSTEMGALSSICGNGNTNNQLSTDKAGVCFKVNYEELREATRHFSHDLQIGEGGSCKVFKAEVSGTACAIKVLSVDASAWEEKQFEAEVALLSTAKHPNICRLIACSVDGPQKCLVLELMDCTLDDRLAAWPPLGWEQRVWIAIAVCRGLVYLHSLTPVVIHR